MESASPALGPTRRSPSVPIQDAPVKKPIPLPRFKNLMRRESLEKSNSPPQNEYANTESKEDSPKNSMSQMIRDEFKSASDNVQERSKLVMQSTRRLARNMIPKRFTSNHEYNWNRNPLLSGAISNRSISLPTDDIFQTISFDSPLSQTCQHSGKSGNDITCDDGGSFDSPVGNQPPPNYPPPPNPDETFYDEVLSVKSNNSGSQQDSFYWSSETDSYRDIDGIYEELSNTRSKAVSDDIELARSSQLSDSDTASLPVLARTVKKFSRSDSWTYYDTVSCPIEVGVTGEFASNIYNEDPVATRKMMGSSPSITSELEALTMDDAAMTGSSCQSSVDMSHSSASFSSASGHGSNAGCSFSSSSCIGNDGVEMRKKSKISPQKTASKSVILEFDPLYENVPTAESLVSSGLQQDDLMILAGLVPAKISKTSNYGKVSLKSKEMDCSSNDSPASTNAINNVTIIEEEGEPCRPPTPPRRLDSISLASTEIGDHHEAEDYGYDVPDDACSVSSLKSSAADSSFDGEVMPRRFSLIKHHWPRVKKVMKLAYQREGKVLPSEVPASPDKSLCSAFYTDIHAQTDRAEKPALEPVLAVQYSGPVYRSNSGSQEMNLRWCHLADSALTCSIDKSTGGSKDVIPLDSVLSVQVVHEHHNGLDGEELHCFEVTSTGKSRGQMFGVTASMERRVWMQKILENFTTVFPTRVAARYTRFGWCYLKEGIGGRWMAAWLLLHKRTLYYYIPKGSLSEADLRKARSIVIQESDSVSPLILIDFPKVSLYVRTERTSETLAWRSAIRSAATDNGPELDSQQLTLESVPVLVEKCINFVCAYGSLSEGIYRRSGANSSVTKLLAMFRQDAWAVQLSRQDFSEYDVASVLKRFFRDLPEPLLTSKLHPLLCETAVIQDESARLDTYKNLLGELPLVNAVTVRCLLAHLHFIHEESQHNLMPVDNLAAIWGPTLMHIENGDEMTWSREESKVIVDLVSMYPRLFAVNAEELARDRKIKEVLQRLHAGRVNPQQVKPTGDLRVGIHIGSKDSGTCQIVPVGPQKLCSELCSELASHLKLLAHQVTLCEVVLGGALHRYLHHSEKVFDTILRWGYWDEQDRAQNTLVLVPNTAFKELQTLISPPITISRELRFADQKTKNFKSYLFEFSQAKLSYYKDKRGSIKLAEWPVEDIVWYQGFEPKRNPNSRWALTFISKIDKPKRSKDRPFFGCTMAGTCKEDENKWMAALLAAEYPQGLLPAPVPLNLLE